MALSVKATLGRVARLRHKLSAAFLLQLAACAVVAWSVMHGGITLEPFAAPAAAGAADSAPVPQGTPPAAAAGVYTTSVAMQLAAVPTLADARLALSTID